VGLQNERSIKKYHGHKLDEVIELLRLLVAMELDRGKLSREAIGKRLHIAKSSVVEMLKDFKTGDSESQKERCEVSKENSDELSKKLNVLIALSIKQLTGDRDLNSSKKRKSNVGDQARYLASMGLDPKDISLILGAPLSSVRTLLTPGRQK
jgi:predicted transcriptional regulator